MNSFVEWKLKNSTHMDDRVEVQLTNIKERINGTNLYKDEKIEWNDNGVMNQIGTLFESLPFCSISETEIKLAFQVMDNFIRDHYKNNEKVMLEYERLDKIPEDIKDTFLASELRKPFWETLLAINQAKMCNCKVLRQPIPTLPDLDIAIWSGVKVLTPFVSQMNTNFRTIILRGKMRSIDSFIETYKLNTRKVNF